MNIRFTPPVSGIIAGAKSRIASLVKGEADKDAIADGEGNALYKEDIIREVLEELDKRKTDRTPLELQWNLNANFLMGNQFCDINPTSMEIEQVEAVFDWLEREQFNQISPLVETRIANLQKITYLMKVNPATNELDDYAKADVSTSILQWVQKNTDFNGQLSTALHWNELCGNCFFLSWWDSSKGELQGVDSDGKHYFQGDLDYGIITPYEVYPESLFKRTVKAQRDIIIEQVKNVDEIYDLYGIEVEGTEIDTFELCPLPSGGGFGYESTTMSLGHKRIENAQKVVTKMERPSRRHPEGRLIIIVGEEHLVYYGPLPYKRIPLVQMVCREVTGQFFGKSAIEDLIPRQRAYNGCLNRIHEYIKRVGLGNFAIERGAIADWDEFYEEGFAPGKTVVYEDGHNPPVPINIGSLPGELMQERYNLKSDMEYIAGTSQLMVNGAVPSGVTSGTAIENLVGIDALRLSVTGNNMRTAVQDLAKIWLEIYKVHAKGNRAVNFIGTNSIAKAFVWSSDDITSYDVEFTTINELILSEEKQKNNFMELWNMGFFLDSNGKVPDRVKLAGMEHFRVGNYSELLSMNTLHIQNAQRENVFFQNGVMPEVSEFDDHRAHEEEHVRYVLQMEFKLLKAKKPEMAKAFEDHIRQHREMQTKEDAQKMVQAMGAMPKQMM